MNHSIIERTQSANNSLHALLLLSDSALPLGSFAFSSGLESFLAHHKQTNNLQRLESFERFLEHSIRNISSTALPYVLSAYHEPARLEVLDNDFDASTPCTVARRASIAQGKAMLSVWERALCHSVSSGPNAQAAATALTAFSSALKAAERDIFGLTLNAHFPPLSGAVCAALGLSKRDTAYIFLLNHAKTLLSAAVRASVLGPYQSQAILASAKLQDWIQSHISPHSRGTDDMMGMEVEDAAVTVPTMDLWMGRHELLYSRIFNS